MAVLEGGTSAALAEVGVGVAGPLHVVSKPSPYGALGHYSDGSFTGIIPAALAANSEIYQFRWTDATRFAVIRRIRLAAAVTTTFFAAGVPVQLDLVKASAWSGQGTGGATPTLTTLHKRRNATMGSTLVAAGDIRIATTAALGVGTKTLEGASVAAVLAAGPITASLNGTIIPPGFVLFEAEVGEAGHPLVLATNEGFVIRSVAVPATGTWMAAIETDWAEVTAY